MRRALLVILLSGSLALNIVSAKPVAVFVPRFEGPGALSLNVSTILSLYIWTTLRMSPTPNPKKETFGSGIVRWSADPLPDPSIESAVDAARGTHSEMVLWGFVQDYGPGVIVQAFLTIPTPVVESNASNGAWIVKIDNANIVLGLPNSQYDFSALVLSKDIIKKYSRPREIRVCQKKQIPCSGPPLSEKLFRAIQQEGSWALVEQERNVRGWVYLPDLSTTRSEIVEFSAGLMAYFRRDWVLADFYFARVADSKINGPLRFYARILAGISKARAGLDGIAEIERALDSNPYSQYAAHALLLAYVTAIQSKQSAVSQDILVEKGKRLIDEYEHLFKSSDDWLGPIRKYLATVK